MDKFALTVLFLGLFYLAHCAESASELLPVRSHTRKSERRGREHRRRRQRLLPNTPFATTMNIQNPLVDQPNLSQGKKKDTVIIQGSRKAFAITKMEYLKKEWCKTEPVTQVIREEGCLKRKVLNRFCYGQCNSFFIPKINKKDMKSGAFTSCGFCKPKRYSWVTITLRCPGQRQRIKRKRVQMIKQCKCMAQKLD